MKMVYFWGRTTKRNREDLEENDTDRMEDPQIKNQPSAKKARMLTEMADSTIADGNGAPEVFNPGNNPCSECQARQKLLAKAQGKETASDIAYLTLFEQYTRIEAETEELEGALADSESCRDRLQYQLTAATITCKKNGTTISDHEKTEREQAVEINGLVASSMSMAQDLAYTKGELAKSIVRDRWARRKEAEGEEEPKRLKNTVVDLEKMIEGIWRDNAHADETAKWKREKKGGGDRYGMKSGRSGRPLKNILDSVEEDAPSKHDLEDGHVFDDDRNLT